MRKTDFQSELSDSRLKDWLAESGKDTVYETTKGQGQNHALVKRMKNSYILFFFFFKGLFIFY